MPPRERTTSVLGDDHGDLPEEANPVTDPDDALAAAEEADAEAAEAEAQAAAARARARAIRLRRQAAKAAAAPAIEVPAAAAAAPLTTPAEATPTAVADAESTVTDLNEPAEVPAEDDETVEDYPADPPKRRRYRSALKAVAAALVIVASVAFIGISAVMFMQHKHVEAQRQQAAEFTAAARQGAVTLMSLNFNTAKADVQRIIDNTTGDFKKNFQDQADDFIKVAQTSKAVTSATVTSVGIQKMTKDTATALVTVTTRVSNMASDKQDPRAWRLSVDLARDGDQIKLAKVEFVP